MIDWPTSSFQRGRWDSPDDLVHGQSPAASTTVWATSPVRRSTVAPSWRPSSSAASTAWWTPSASGSSAGSTWSTYSGPPPRRAMRAARRTSSLESGRPSMQTITRSPTAWPGAAPGQLVAEQVALLLLGDLAQGQGPQGGQVVGAEEVQQGRPHLVGRVDPALGDPLAQGVGQQVGQDHLVGLVQQPVGEGLADPDPGELEDLVVEALQVLDVHGGEHVDAGVQQLLDVLQRLGLRPPGWLGMGQLVDQVG